MEITEVLKEFKITEKSIKKLIFPIKDRKKENYYVILKTTQNVNSTEDILEDFCKYCADEYKFYLTGKVWIQQIYTNHYNEWKSSPSNNYRKLDTIILKNDIKDEIKNDIQLFLNSEEWYQHRDIPYTRGYLFYGKPGTGKTSMIKGLSLFSKRHIHYLMLNEVENDSQLLELVKNINYKETILVIEDIDAMLNIVKSRNEKVKTYEEFMEEQENTVKMTVEEWKKREYEKKKSTITLSGLLNIIDGLFSCHGRILIMTTNHPEILDSALIRPGRIDCKFLFDNCDITQIGKLYEMFFNIKLSDKNREQLSKINTNEYSPAHITSIFLKFRNNPEIALDELKILEKKLDCNGDINIPSIYQKIR
jgi:AAA+ superfamily predicted ATPase